ncbi:tetratricopeptide repeat protein [bacterium]|nr:tetratricopeptide repeat protein [bacterium]
MKRLALITSMGALVLVCSIALPMQAQDRSPSDLFAEANLLYVQENYQGARTLYQQYVERILASPQKLDKNLGLALFLIGNTFIKTDNYRQALVAFKRACEYQEENDWIDDSTLKIAEIKTRHSSRESLQSALEDYSWIIEHHPRGNCVLAAIFGQGKILIRLGQWQEAEQKLMKVFGSNPPEQMAIEVLLSLGDFYRMPGNALYNLPKSIKYYNEILTRFPKTAPFASTHLALANSYREARDYPKAISHYQKIITEFSDSVQAPLAQSMLGLCYEESSKIDQSLRTYTDIKAIPVSPLLKDTVSHREKKVRRLHKDAIQVKADTNNYDADQGRAQYTGNVSITWNEVIFTCEKATAHINKSFIIAEGNVSCISRRDLKITSQMVHFFPKIRKADFYGEVEINLVNPSFQATRAVAKGKKITYNFESDTYVVED